MLEVITGPMFSGKSEELIRRLKRAFIAGQNVQVFKPQIDTRYGLEHITSHDGRQLEAIPVVNSKDILRYLYRNADVIGIDEIQFLDEEALDIVNNLIAKKVRVLVSCLSMDFRGEPFPFRNSPKTVGELFAICDQITKLTSICTHKTPTQNGDKKICGKPAIYSQRIINGEPAPYNAPTILIAAHEAYEARCRDHFIIPGKPVKNLSSYMLPY